MEPRGETQPDMLKQDPTLAPEPLPLSIDKEKVLANIIARVESMLVPIVNSVLERSYFSDLNELHAIVSEIPDDAAEIHHFLDEIEPLGVFPIEGLAWHMPQIHYLLQRYPNEKFNQVMPDNWYSMDEEDKPVLDEESLRKLEHKMLYSDAPEDKEYSSTIDRSFMDWLNDLKEKLDEYTKPLERVVGADNPEAKKALTETIVKLKLTEKELFNRIGYLSKLNETIQNPENESPIDALDNETAVAQIKLREELVFGTLRGSEPEPMGQGVGVETSDNAKQFLDAISSIVSQNGYDPRHIRGERSATEEQELQYAHLILSPSLSTAEFAIRLKEIVEGIEQGISDEVNDQSQQPIDSYSLKRFVADSIVNKGLLREFGRAVNNGKFKGWEGKRIIEIGGENAARGLKNMGAEVIAAIWADQPRYGKGLTGMYDDRRGAGKAINETNYTEFADPHSIDLICTSRVFDTGSGVEQVPGGAISLVKVMSELLSDKGLMVHFDCSLLGDLPEKFGSNRLIDLSSLARIYRYHQREQTDSTAPQHY